MGQLTLTNNVTSVFARALHETVVKQGHEIFFKVMHL